MGVKRMEKATRKPVLLADEVINANVWDIKPVKKVIEIIKFCRNILLDTPLNRIHKGDKKARAIANRKTFIQKTLELSNATFVAT